VNAAVDVRRQSFRAMGTEVTLLGSGDPAAFARAVAAVRATFEEDEQRFSRFRADSELSLVNAAAGRWTNASEPFMRLLRYALGGARRSGGLFDPTILGSLVAAGYDRDFAEVQASPGPLRPLPMGSRPNWTSVEVGGRSIRLPEGVGLDFGGVAKGWTVDRAAMAARRMLPWALVNAGGDLRLVGRPQERWLDIAVEDPMDIDAEAARVRLEGGGLASSSVSARAWGEGRHHLIDPRTALPAATEVIQATVWAETCAEAEIRSKWALLAGPPALDRFPGILVLTGNRILTNMVMEEAA
jgi:FAD:protein FMN transferase